MSQVSQFRGSPNTQINKVHCYLQVNFLLNLDPYSMCVFFSCPKCDIYDFSLCHSDAQYKPFFREKQESKRNKNPRHNV
ncbi:CLUMA_CG013597, isoform A [Clunio marinus]|uniref:CLUMA_CG013597, isoform A n=1 Tax=Clunio marinus TaxID=568069 RepID=A0A1J1IL92_9DIPT|nr:CLUMA_CG013597, isoform A [Clunio marinus]